MPGVSVRLSILLLASFSSVAGAQLVPQIGQTVGGVFDNAGGRINRLGDNLSDSIGGVGRAIDRLAKARLDRIGDLVRRNPDALEYDARGDAAVNGELILIDPPEKDVAAAMAKGFALIDRSRVEGLGIATVRLQSPAGLTLAKAERLLAKIAPGATIQSNPIYQPSGGGSAPASTLAATATTGPGAAIGIIDSGVAAHPALPTGIQQRGFASGAPTPGNHGTAIASILVGRGSVRGVSPQSRLLVADVYGRDPRGGNALAIARALGWLTASGARVVNISLAGPDNPLLARAIAAADRRGVLMVAAVGNDGAAAPPAYPASYPQVIAVTGIDGRGRPLIEAGKARHVDFAAPGADLLAARVDGGTAKLRGTSYAAPFVVGRLARLSAAGAVARPRALSLLTAEAVPARRGDARLVGRGVICTTCPTR